MLNQDPVQYTFHKQLYMKRQELVVTLSTPLMLSLLKF